MSNVMRTLFGGQNLALELRQALLEGADALDANGDVWARSVEEAIYRGYGLPYPLNLS